MSRYRARAWAIATLAALFLVGASAAAHRTGLSQGRYEITRDGVASELTFARAEFIERFAERAGEGIAPSEAELRSAAQENLISRIQVSSPTGTCTGVVTGVRPVAPDGIVVEARHTCPDADGPLRADLRFLELLEHGHRHLAHVVAEKSTTQVVAYKGNAGLELGAPAALERGRSFPSFVRLGAEHILGGADHLLFLLGVVLIPAAFRSTLLAVTAFTVAHSITLGATVFGVVAPSPRFVEPLILLSVAFMGLENLRRRGPDGLRRALLTFTFGLIHGFGFAGALGEIAIPRAELPVALLGFNVGVELGQLLVLVPLVVVLRYVAAAPWFSRRAVPALSVALASVGLVWAAGRVVVDVRSAALRTPIASAVSPARGVVRPASSGALPGAADPLVDALCRAFNELPRIRRAECKGEKPGVTMAAECRRLLGQTLSAGALEEIGRAEADRCLAALSARYADCDFAKEASLPVVEACRGLFHGRLENGAVCGSSLECRDGLHCDGAGPMDRGHCLPARGEGESCGLALDPLVSYLPAGAADAHRECVGECVNTRCRTLLADGARGRVTF